MNNNCKEKKKKHNSNSLYLFTPIIFQDNAFLHSGKICIKIWRRIQIPNEEKKIKVQKNVHIIKEL